MASYKDVLKVIGSGDNAALEELARSVPPSILKRILGGARLRQRIALEQELTSQAASHRLAKSLDRLVERCLEIAEDGEGETARKATLEMMEQAREDVKTRADTQARAADTAPAELTRKAQAALIKELIWADALDVGYLQIDMETGRYVFEECIRAGYPYEILYENGWPKAPWEEANHRPDDDRGKPAVLRTCGCEGAKYPTIGPRDYEKDNDEEEADDGGNEG
jgi:hypothetical protein